MKKPPSKKDLRCDLQSQVDAYLDQGGSINEVERGKSGLDHAKPWINPFKTGESEKSLPRTPVPEVLAAIDARKNHKSDTKPRRSGPSKRWIYDDFGEPIRWEWVE